MTIIFSERKNTAAAAVSGLLQKKGACCISDRRITGGRKFPVVNAYRPTVLETGRAAAVLFGGSGRFAGQTFPPGVTGICEDTDLEALALFRESNIPVISCGMNPKSTLALSSLSGSVLFASLQRTVTDLQGIPVEPGEFGIHLSAPFSPFPVMAAAAVLLLNGIRPDSF